MKLVIEIPKERYEEYKRIGDSRDILFEAIRKGKPLDTVLDKMREEIKSKKFGLTDTEDGRRIQSDIHAGFDGGIECALQIIDKYKESEVGE